MRDLHQIPPPELREPLGRGGRKSVGTKLMEDTGETRSSESTKQGVRELTETKAASTDRVQGVYAAHARPILRSMR